MAPVLVHRRRREKWSWAFYGGWLLSLVASDIMVAGEGDRGGSWWLLLPLRGDAGSPEERDDRDKGESREVAPVLMLPLVAGTSTNHGGRWRLQREEREKIK